MDPIAIAIGVIILGCVINLERKISRIETHIAYIRKYIGLNGPKKEETEND